MPALLPGLGPDSSACVARYLALCAEPEPGPVFAFLEDLAARKEEKYLLLIITSKVARLADKSREAEILDRLFGLASLPLYLRVYANTRSCYMVSNAPDLERARLCLQRGYQCLHERQACGSSESSKRDRLHLGFSAMLAMLHVQLTHRLWRDAHALSAGAIAEIGRFPEGPSLTDSYYGTCTRIARIIAIQYMLDMALDHNLEGATRYAALLRQSFSLALSRADLNLTRFSEFTMSLPVYQSIVESQARMKTPDQTIDELAKIAVIIKRKGRNAVATRLKRKWLKAGLTEW